MLKIRREISYLYIATGLRCDVEIQKHHIHVLNKVIEYIIKSVRQLEFDASKVVKYL